MWAAGGLSAGVALGALAYGARSRSSTLFAPSIYRGSSQRRSLGLTFDDGPTPGTSEILRLLAEYKIRATFFQCGINARRYPDFSREASRAGHELGNHTDTHPLLALRNRQFIYDQLARAQDGIEQASGSRPVLFRAPFGVRWFGLREAQRSLGLMGVMWTIIGRDWRLSAEAIERRLLRGIGPGAILCLHDGRQTEARPDIGATVEAVRRVVPQLLQRGYTFETVSELCQKS